MKRDAFRITDEPGSVRLSWSTFGGQLGLKLLITLLVGSPIIGLLILTMTQLAARDAFLCAGVAAVIGVVIWLLITGKTEVRLDASGVVRTVCRPLWIVSTTAIPGPIDLRIAPLLNTSESLGGAPTQFMAVLMPVNRSFAPIESVVLSASEAARLKEAAVRASVPGLTLDLEVSIQDETRPDCRVCGYDLVGSADVGKCPECGEPIDAGHQRSLVRMHALRLQRER